VKPPRVIPKKYLIQQQPLAKHNGLSSAHPGWRRVSPDIWINAHMLRHAAGCALAARGIDTRTLPALMGHRSIANRVVYTAVADKRIRNIWGKWLSR
jgi:integrase